MPAKKGEKITLLSPTFETIIFISLFSYACLAMSFMPGHVTEIRCFEFRYFEFSFG